MALYLSIVKTVTVIKLADLFLDKVVCCFGTPKEIIFNYNSIFASKF